MQMAALAPRSGASALLARQQRKGGAATRHGGPVHVSSRLVLVPVGDGNTEHLAEPVPMPGAITLSPGLFELGRGPPADIVVPIPTISGRHCMIRVADDESVTLTDLGSTNGTYVGGQEVEPMRSAPLPPGAQVVFGDESLAAFRLDLLPDEPAVAGVASGGAEQQA